jgi:hypothetical protein
VQTAQQICLLASTIAKGGTGMVGLAGQFLNLTLQDLKLNRDLKVNRVTQTLNVTAGSNGPFTLETDYLRTYDMFYPLQGPNGMTQFLTPITMEQYDQEWKNTSVANYPYEFATDLSTQAKTATAIVTPTGTVGSLTVAAGGSGYLSFPALGFSGGGGSGAAGSAHMGYSFGGIFAAGAGYVVGDSVTVLGGTAIRPAKLLVRTVGGGGTVTNFVITDPGEYSVVPGFAVPQITTGGTGNGLTWGWLELTVTAAVVTAAGSGYTSAPTVAVTGGSGTGARVTAALAAGSTVLGTGQLYIYPQSSGALAITHRYMRDQPDITNPQSSLEVPWFGFQQYLIHQVAALMMGVSGDERQATFLSQAEHMLQPHLIMEGDEQQAVKYVKLDPRHFKSNRGLRPTKVNPY